MSRPAFLAIFLLLPIASACGGGESGGGADADPGHPIDGGGEADASADAAPPAVFERFRLARTAGPCQEDADCQGFDELLADGTLRVDRFGELPVVVHQAAVTPEELADAIVVLTDPALIELLASDEPPCVGPSDVYETMTLEHDGVEDSVGVKTCTDAPLVAARTVLAELVMAYDLE